MNDARETRETIDRQALATWLRQEMDDADSVELGEGYQASVRRVMTPFGDYVIKRAHAHFLAGRFIKATVAREAEVYERLAGIPGIPAFHGLIDGKYLVLEYVPGASLRQKQHELADRDAFFAALLQTLEKMHAAGIAHGDLKRKDNVLVDPDERPYLIDFGTACIRFEHGGRLNARWFEAVKQMDLNAWIKLKYGRRPHNLPSGERLTEADAALYRELWIERIARWFTTLARKLGLRQ